MKKKSARKYIQLAQKCALSALRESERPPHDSASCEPSRAPSLVPPAGHSLPINHIIADPRVSTCWHGCRNGPK